MNNAATYTISWTNGARDEQADSYEAAKAIVLAQYPDAEIGHDGDLEGFGDRTLCWATAEDSVDDDGARAVCSIRVAS
jgi:hypothetical protein